MSESTHSTGDTPVEGIDPGGTHSTHPGKQTEKGRTVEHTVEGGSNQDAHPERSKNPE